MFQCGNTAFRRKIGPLTVIGVPVAHCGRKKQRRALYASALKEIDLNEDILIFGADLCSVPVKSPHCIAIQHGVSWDVPLGYGTKNRLCRSHVVLRLRKRIHIRSAIRKFENCPNRVCVDYNFLNWYRTVLTGELSGKVWTILNPAPLAKSEEVAARGEATGCVRVLFARRFERYRGTRMMAHAAAQLFRDNDNVSFTFAGEGPDEEWLHHFFSGESRVSFTKYVPSNVITTLMNHDVAVVPSLGSEGSSISVAEAMGAGCAVVATAVGGITNMIINDYNGLLVMPHLDSLLAGLRRVISDVSLRRELGRNAYQTATKAFSLERWKRSWQAVLEEVTCSRELHDNRFTANDGVRTLAAGGLRRVDPTRRAGSDNGDLSG